MISMDKCNKCGGELVYRQEGRIQGAYCMNCCTWAVIATYFPEYEVDETDYCIYAINAQFEDLNKIRVVSAITGMNYLDVRKLLQQDKTIIFKGKAPEIMKIRKTLDDAGMHYEIEPDFKYT
jgi:hypothetical protein